MAHAISQLGGDTSNLTAVLTSGMSQFGAADVIRQLTQEQQLLAERFGPQYLKVRELQAQIDRIRGRTRGAHSRLEGDEVRDLVRSIEQSLDSVQAVRNELGKQFGQAQEKARQVEEDLLAEEVLRGKLERQRAQFSAVVDQLKQCSSSAPTAASPPRSSRLPRPLVPGLAPGKSDPGPGLVVGGMLGRGLWWYSTAWISGVSEPGHQLRPRRPEGSPDRR